MSILDSKSKKMLVESMRSCVKNILNESAVLTAKQATDKSKFVSEQATYEQLLNITMNPLRESKYLPDYVLEGAVAILHRACLTGRKYIGVNAITEGALKLHHETGAVITESMLDAALKSVEDGCGLKVVGEIVKEATILTEADHFIRDILSRITDPGDRALIMGALTGSGKSVAGYTMAERGAIASILSRAGVRNPAAANALASGDKMGFYRAIQGEGIRQARDAASGLNAVRLNDRLKKLQGLKPIKKVVRRGGGSGAPRFSPADINVNMNRPGMSTGAKLALGAAAVAGLGYGVHRYLNRNKDPQEVAQ